MQTERKYWFPAKRYGWGWGIPCSWRGWLVLAAFRSAARGWLIPLSTRHGPRCLPCLCLRPLRPPCLGVLAQGRAAALALG
jgi:hypothetical protein